MAKERPYIGTDWTKHISVVAAQSVLRGSRFLRAPFQISKRAAGEATEFSRSGVELLGVISAARLECGEPPAETGELIRRQLGNSFGDFFNLHVMQYSIERLVERRKMIGYQPAEMLGRRSGLQGGRLGVASTTLSSTQGSLAPKPQLPLRRQLESDILQRKLGRTFRYPFHYPESRPPAMGYADCNFPPPTIARTRT